MNYPSIRIEGAILSPDILERIEDAAGQRPADFGLDATSKVKEEIVRAWADAQDYWRIFQRKLETVKPSSPATTETRQQWIQPLLGLLGYQLEFQSKGVKLNDKIYAISHRVQNGGQTPVHIIGYQEPAGLDRKPENATLRMSAHAMVQEYLNLHDELYGIVTNGRVLRLLRDSSRLIKLTYLEFDLDRIFTDGLFADFAILYRLMHVSRLPASPESAPESLIERYHQDSLDSGARIRDGLSKAVENAIRDFANGFLHHPDNEALREEVAAEKLAPGDLYQQLLRLIYRLLFLMVIEERDLVFPLDADSAKRDIYYRYYSIQRLRHLAEKRYLADRRRHDLWLSMLATFRLFEAGGPGQKLGLAPLAGDLFSPLALGKLGECTLGNDVLLGCLRYLGIYQHPDTHQLIRVNYSALNVEEFGSVYEGLLEYSPEFIRDENHIDFVFAQGDERSATGSHYTPDDLVQPLIKNSLDYLIADKLKEKDPENALLSLRVADISCGSGHILLSAARRIATELAIVRTGEEQPSPPAMRAAIRDVIRECIYGVDLNPLAVELCKVALWLEAHSPGQPLNFLDHHIKCGNAIVGFARREEVERGVPDEAFATLPDDEKKTAAAFRKRNKDERKGRELNAVQQVLTEPGEEIRKQLDEILAKWKSVSRLPEKTPEEIEAKKERYQEFSKSQDAWLLNQIAAIPIAQFYLPKTPETKQQIITDAEFQRFWSGERTPQGQATAAAWATAHRKRFFHWFLEFPEIIENGGFDCILGNPPYLGGQALSGTYGNQFCSYVKWEYSPTGLSELLVFFLRRIYSLLKPAGFTSFITTNSIKDGDVRRDGLEQVILSGGTISFAIRGIKWPGRANLVVSLVGVCKANWAGPRNLDGIRVSSINAYFEEGETEAEPSKLLENGNEMMNASEWNGDGFVISVDQAYAMQSSNPCNADVVIPLINGDTLNSSPVQHPDRYAIYFSNMSSSSAKKYSLPFEWIQSNVKPYRDKSKNKKLKRDWWLFKRATTDLYDKLHGLSACFALARTTKYLSLSRMPTTYIFSEAIKIFTTDRWDLFSVVQSTIHEVWARKYSGSLETRLRYSPSDCFSTYPFPEGLWQTDNPTLTRTGERYHEHRRSLMLGLWLGLTDIYNLFHDPEMEAAVDALYEKRASQPDWTSAIPAEHRATAEAFSADQAKTGLADLRHMHHELDMTLLHAYGWSNLDLEHGFHEVETLPENDRVRYTISPAARKEVLKRLLLLNHERAAAEAEQAKALEAAKPKAKRKGLKKKSISENMNGDIFAKQDKPLSKPDIL